MKYPFQPDVQAIFPDFNYTQCSPPGAREFICNMAHPNNQVGHQQRAFTTFWAVQMCGPLDLGLDLGATRGLTPYCIHVDKYGTGKPHGLYKDPDQVPVWADVVADMANLSMFPENCFPYVASNHSIEHLDVSRFTKAPPLPMYPIEEEARKRWLGNSAKGRYGGAYLDHIKEFDSGVVQVLRSEWIRVLRPKGVLAICVPDHSYLNVFDADRDHRHAWCNEDFEKRILSHLVDIVDVIEFDTLKNQFSFNAVLRKK